MLGHASNIVSQRRGVIPALSRVEAEKLGKGRAVLGILVNTKFNVLAKGSVELVELLTILGDLVEHFKSLLDNVFLDNLQDLVLLESLTRQVEWEILRIDDSLDETKPFRNQIGTVVSNEYTADVELDVVLGALSLKQVERSALRDEKDSTEFKLTLNREMLDSKMIFPVVGQRLVEAGIFLSGDV